MSRVSDCSALSSASEISFFIAQGDSMPRLWHRQIFDDPNAGSICSQFVHDVLGRERGASRYQRLKRDLLEHPGTADLEVFQTPNHPGKYEVILYLEDLDRVQGKPWW